jgi:hypothetical protein
MCYVYEYITLFTFNELVRFVKNSLRLFIFGLPVHQAAILCYVDEL